MKAITEETDKDLLNAWQEEARKQTLETLPAFLQKLATGYTHDYGTICHALAAAACGAAWAMNASEQGHITGFQGGAVMWQFIRAWQYSGNECGLRILDYDNMLYPQYADKFTGQYIDADTWKRVQDLAKRKLAQGQAASEQYTLDYAQWALDIADFKRRYPDYDQRPAHYNRLGMGTGAEWAAEKQKEDSGFEFAPREPHAPLAAGQVLHHWKSLAAGRLPFKMILLAD
jgi:hypothetical protein